MSAVRTTPSRRSALARMPSVGSSFASCFGASTPISPRRMGGHGLLGGQACVNYRRLGLDELDEDEHTCIYEKPAQEEEEGEDRYGHPEQRRESPILQRTQHLSLEESGVHDASEGEEYPCRERETENVKKLGKQWSRREEAGMQTYHEPETPLKVEEPYASEQEGEEHGRERKSIRKLAKMWSLREKNTIYAAETPEKQEERHHATGEEEGEAVGYARERKGLLKLAKLWTMREKVRREVQSASSEEEIDEYGRERTGDQQHLRMREREEGMTPRRESLSRKVKEACAHMMESARRSSPHLGELFVGNQLLMQVTSSSFVARRAARSVPPSTGFLVAGEPPLSTVSPPRSSTSSTL